MPSWLIITNLESLNNRQFVFIYIVFTIFSQVLVCHLKYIGHLNYTLQVDDPWAILYLRWCLSIWLIPLNFLEIIPLFWVSKSWQLDDKLEALMAEHIPYTSHSLMIHYIWATMHLKRWPFACDKNVAKRTTKTKATKHGRFQDARYTTVTPPSTLTHPTPKFQQNLEEVGLSSTWFSHLPLPSP